MPTSIDEVIESLDEIIEESRVLNPANGYFPALYRQVTAKVKEGIERNAFEDSLRMEELDVVFADRYLEAYRSQNQGERCTRSWKIAFENAQNHGLIVLQHLLLGMNAHINLDLGIAAAEIASRNPIALKEDFRAINAVLGSQLDDVQRRLTRVFGPLGWLDRLLGKTDERLSLFSIEYARDKAWTQTLELCLAPSDARAGLIESRDEAVAAFARKLVRPNRTRLRLLIWLIRRLERGSPIDRLAWLSD